MSSATIRHAFRIPIGDWSDDGHGKVEWFYGSAAKPIDDVREAYFAAKKRLPTECCPENYCERYEDSSIPAEVIAVLREHGAPESALSEFESDAPDDRVRAFADLVAWYVNQGDPMIDVRLDGEAPPMLPFYGSDKKRRHIGFHGYGLFS